MPGSNQGQELLLGVDLGTTGVKTAVIDAETGDRVAGGYSGYPTAVSADRHEQDPADWWTAAVTAVRSAVPSDGRIVGVGLSGHMHALVLVDASDTVVRPVMTWADRRSTPQVRRLRAHADVVARRCANLVVEAFTAPKLAWMAEHEPAALQRSVRLVLPKDVLRFRLTGTWGTDRTDAWGTLLYDIHRDVWDTELFALCGADSTLGPQVAAPETVVGECTSAAAAELGLDPGTPVVAGASDLACSALGAGAISTGVMLVNVGTAAQVVAPVPSAQPGPLFTFGRADGPGGLAMASLYAAGLSVDWAADLLLDPGAARPGAGPPGPALDELAREADPTVVGPVFVPHLLGTSVPTHDGSVRGAFLGLDPTHDRPVLARAVLEGVAHACSAAVDHVEAATEPPQALRIAGGLARSVVWSGAMAAAAEVPVDRVEGDASPVGAAMLAGMGIGLWAGADEAEDRCVRLHRIEPPVGAHRDRLDTVARRHAPALATVEAFAHDQRGDVAGSGGNHE